MRRAALLLVALLLGCAGPPRVPEGPSLVWADEAADIWLQAVRRNDPGAVFEMLSRASRVPYPSVEAFRKEGLSRVQSRYSDFALPGAAERQVFETQPGQALAALWRADGRAAAFPLVWEDEDWKVEWRAAAPPRSPQDLPPDARVWVDGQPGSMQLQPGPHRVAALLPASRGPAGAAAWILGAAGTGRAGAESRAPKGRDRGPTGEGDVE